MEILTCVPFDHRWFDEDGSSRDVEMTLDDTVIEYRDGRIWHYHICETEEEYGLRILHVEPIYGTIES